MEGRIKECTQWLIRWLDGTGDKERELGSMFLDEEKGVEELKEQDGWSVTD